MAKTHKPKNPKQEAASGKPLKRILKREPKSLKEPENLPLLSDSDSEPDKLTALLEPYSKDQLIELIAAAAAKTSVLYDHIREAADRDVAHRKIFVHGLGRDATQEDLVSAFGDYGDIEECKLVTDKATGKAKGFAFILFKTRKGALKALKNPQRMVSNRMASCQLASLGPTVPVAPAMLVPGERKIYVSNVQRDVHKEQLREFFEKFGEIETGPFGFDINTGKSRGFAIFVYKATEGAKKALEEPYKMFQGHQLHCRKAADGKNRKINSTSNSSNQLMMQQMLPGLQQVQGQDQGQVLAAMAASQNLALFGQHPGLNPAYGGGLFVNPGLINPMVAGALNPGVGAIPGSLVLGSYRAGAGASQGLQQHVYPNVSQGTSQGNAGGVGSHGSTSYM